MLWWPLAAQRSGSPATYFETSKNLFETSKNLRGGEWLAMSYGRCRTTLPIAG
jgi:hypothetical protein